MQNQLRILYESEGYRMESMNTDGEAAQVTLLWDERCLPRCVQCDKAMRINRKTRQSAFDLALGPVTFVGVLYEAVQGYCRHCGRYETVRPLGIVEQHMPTLRLMRQVSLLCRWLPVQRVCEVVAVTPASACHKCRSSVSPLATCTSPQFVAFNTRDNRISGFAGREAVTVAHGRSDEHCASDLTGCCCSLLHTTRLTQRGFPLKSGFANFSGRKSGVSISPKECRHRIPLAIVC